jgi:hypothetical protein
MIKKNPSNKLINICNDGQMHDRFFQACVFKISLRRCEAIIKRINHQVIVAS